MHVQNKKSYNSKVGKISLGCWLLSFKNLADPKKCYSARFKELKWLLNLWGRSPLIKYKFDGNLGCMHPLWFCFYISKVFKGDACSLTETLLSLASKKVFPDSNNSMTFLPIEYFVEWRIQYLTLNKTNLNS